MLKEKTVFASLSAAPPTPLIPFPLISNGRGTHKFVATTVQAAGLKCKEMKRNYFCLTEQPVSSICGKTFLSFRIVVKLSCSHCEDRGIDSWNELFRVLITVFPFK
jgi:hypothetical protein